MFNTRLLVCGGRNYNDWDKVNFVLNAFKIRNELTCIVQGGARGADALAKRWAFANGVPCIQIDAQWDYYGRHRAGPVRNLWMLELIKPNFFIAFPGGSGTADMIKKCQADKVDGWIY